MSVTTLVAVGDDVEIVGDGAARYAIYSVTKTAVAAAVLLLAREGAIELGSVRRLLDHRSGVRDYGSLREYHEAVRTRPGSAWDDDEFLARADAAGPQFEPGKGWAYSNTGYLLLRRLLDEHGGLGGVPAALRSRGHDGRRAHRRSRRCRSGAERAAPRRRR